MKNNECNLAKSRHGTSLNATVKQLILDLLVKNKIQSFQPEPRYNHPSTKEKQFSPDGEITLLNGKIIVYGNTKTIRHDRLKQKLGDAYGTNKIF